jgi:hypothetical protein
VPDIVPCSITGCKAPGTRWVHEEVQVTRPAFPPGYRSLALDIPRFVCDGHAKEFLAKGHSTVTPHLQT